MNRVSVVDYGSGNILSVQRALEKSGAKVVLASTPEQVRQCDRLVLPGVGAFADCMDRLREQGLIEPLLDVARSGKPFLGICVGMQILMETGFEFGEHDGLGLLSGVVQRLPGHDVAGRRLKRPHIGWNALKPPSDQPERWHDTYLHGELPGGSQVYFVHSYAAVSANREDVLAVCEYGGHEICAAVQKENISGTQFHPEKSAAAGLLLLERFVNQ